MNGGTYQAIGPAIDSDEADRLQRVLDDHAQVDGRCRVCGTRRRCWTGAAAWARLILADRPIPGHPAA